MDRIRISVIIDVDVLARLDKLAKHDHRSRSRQIAALTDEESERRQQARVLVDTPTTYDAGTGTA